MKAILSKFFLLCCLNLGFIDSALAQLHVGNYKFEVGTGNHSRLNGTISTATGVDSAQNNIPIGFSFNFGNIAYQTFSISTNGYIRLGGPIQAGSTISAFGVANVHSPIIAPYWDFNRVNSGEISYQLSGVAPHRKLVVDFWSINIGNGNQSITDHAHFNLTLFETTNIITFEYGFGMNAGGALDGAIGIQDLNAFVSVSPEFLATASSQQAINSITNVAGVRGRKYTFTPPISCETAHRGKLMVVDSLFCIGDSLPVLRPDLVYLPGTDQLSVQWEISLDGGINWQNAVAGNGAQSTSYWPGNFNGQNQHYRMRSFCATNLQTRFSDTLSFRNTTIPVSLATQVSASRVTPNSVTVQWLRGNAKRYLVMMAAFPNIPNFVQGVADSFYANAVWQNAAASQAVYDGTSSFVKVTNLHCDSTYYFRVFPYNRCGLAPNITYHFDNATSQNTVTVTTASAAALPAINNFEISQTPAGWDRDGWVINNLAGTTGNPGNCLSATLNATFPQHKFTTTLYGPLSASSRVDFHFKLSNTILPYTVPVSNWGVASVQISTDCGQNYSTIDTISGQQSSGWRFRSISLAAYNGQKLMIRLVVDRLASEFNFSIDNFKVYNFVSRDMAIGQRITPTAPACYGNNDTVAFVVTNVAAEAIDFSISPLELFVTVFRDANQQLNTTINQGILAAGADTIVRIGGLNMSVAGAYQMNAEIIVPGDLNNTNNTAPVAHFTNVDPISANLNAFFNGGITHGFTMNQGTANFALTNSVGRNGGQGMRCFVGNLNRTALLTAPKMNNLSADHGIRFFYRILAGTGPLLSLPADTLYLGDSLLIEISSDCGRSFTPIFNINRSNQVLSQHYQMIEVPLTTYAHHNQLIIRFRAHIGSPSNSLVFDIDDVYIGSFVHRWNGNGNWSNQLANWNHGRIPFEWDKAIIESGSIQVPAGVKVKTLNIKSGAECRLDAVINMQVNDSIINEGLLFLDNSSGLIHQGEGIIVGNGAFVANKNSNNNSNLIYNYWSSPSSAFIIDSLGGSDLYSYDATIQQWQSVLNGTVMQTGSGYLATAAGNVQFKGRFNSGNIQIMVHNFGDGWNLLGNPYPSVLDGAAFLNANPQLHQNLWFWSQPNNATPGQSGGDYAVWNQMGGVQGSLGGPIPNGNIALGQGFMTKATQNGLVQFTNSMRTAQSAPFFRTTASEKFWLSLRNASQMFNQTLIGFSAASTDSFDAAWDAFKIHGNPNISFYSLLNNEALSIQSCGEKTNQHEIKLGYNVALAGKYWIQLDSSVSFDETQPVYLHDAELDIVHNLSSGPYRFLTSAGGFNNRFKLRFMHTISTSVNAVELHRPKLYLYQSTLYCMMIDPSAMLDIYDISGRQIYKQRVTAENMQQGHQLGFPNGIYLVRLQSQNQSSFQKILLNH